MVDAYNFHLTGINDTVNPAVNPEIDYWAKLRQTCESKSNVEKITLPPENESFQMDFVKERLIAISKYIDNKMESIFKIAHEEKDEISAHLLSNEFLEQLIEVLEDLRWLISGIPEGNGRHLLRRYLDAFEKVMEIVKGTERIWWSIRRGQSGLPRNRDYCTDHLFKDLPISSQANTLENWEKYMTTLKESTDGLRPIQGTFKIKCKRILLITFNIFKKIKIKHLMASPAHKLLDDLLDSADPIITIINRITRLLLIDSGGNNFMICDQLCTLSNKLHELIRFFDDENGWFEANLKEIDFNCESLSEMNPMR